MKTKTRVLSILVLMAILISWFPAIEAKADMEPYLRHYPLLEGFYLKDKQPSGNRSWRFEFKFHSGAMAGSEADTIGRARLFASKYTWNDKTANSEATEYYAAEGRICRVAYNVFKVYFPKHKYVKFKVTNGETSPYTIKIVKSNIKISKMGGVKTPNGSYTVGMDWYTSDWHF